MRHDPDDLQVRERRGGQGLGALFDRLEIEAVAAHAAGVQLKMDADRTRMAPGNLVHLARIIEIAGNLLQLVLQAIFDLRWRGRAHAQQPATKARRADNPCLVVAGNPDR